MVSESATIGTLIDLGQYLQDQLSTQHGATWEQNRVTLEQTMFLATGSLAAALRPPPAVPFPDMDAFVTGSGTSTRAQRVQKERAEMHVLAKQEEETGLTRELEGALRTAQAAVERVRPDVQDAENIFRLLLTVLKRVVPADTSS